MPGEHTIPDTRERHEIKIDSLYFSEREMIDILRLNGFIVKRENVQYAEADRNGVEHFNEMTWTVYYPNGDMFEYPLGYGSKSDWLRAAFQKVSREKFKSFFKYVMTAENNWK